MIHRRRGCTFVSALLGATMLGSVPAWAQTAPADPQGDQGAQAPTAVTPASPATADALPPQQESGAGDDIVVTGFRQSYANAIAAKRNSVAITDGISSDGLGRFPDLNVGEALQRVPGVQINREAEGRNATINLRGLPGEYSRLTLNGVAFAEPVLADAAPLGAFNSDIFSSIVIDKSPLADAQSGGLSGNVDLQIAPALGRKEGGFAKAAMEYNELGKLAAPAATIGYNHHFSDDFAVFGVLAYKHENFRRDSILYNNYAPFSAAQAQANADLLGKYYAPSADCPSCTGPADSAGVLYDAQHRQYVRYNVGNLYTGAAGAEYQVNNELKLGVTGFYSDRNLPNTDQYLLITTNNDASVLTANDAPTALHDGRYVVDDFSFSNPDITASSRSFSQHQKVWGVNANAEWKNEDWRVDLIGTVSQAANDSIEIGIDYETLQTADGNGVTGEIRTGGNDVSGYMQTLSPDPVTTTDGLANGVWGGTAAPGAFFDNADPALRRNRFNFQGTQATAKTHLYAGQFDVERKFDGVLSAIQFGGRYEDNAYIAEGYRILAYGLPIQNMTSDFLRTAPFAGDFFGGHGGSPTQNWQTVNLDLAISKLKPVEVFPGAALSPSGYNINYANNAYQLDNYTNSTKLWIGYLQAKYELELGGITIRGNAGLRYERATNTIDALNRVSLTNVIGSPSDFRTQRYRQEYGKWLPSFIAVADITRDFVVRAAAYRTYVRPAPGQFSPSTVVSTPVNGVYAVTLGNPDLKPYDSTSFDISAEWYNRANSLISLALFQKRITGLIATVSDPRDLCPADATDLGLGHLTINGDRCESSLTYDQAGVTTPYLVEATGYVNQANPITVRGVEFNVEQSLDFLPGLLRNLGGGFNYAYTTISGKTVTGQAATLPGVSKHNLNIISYYETKAFGLRLVYNLRSKYDLASTASFTGAARQVRIRGQLDLSSSYNITGAVSLSLDAYNLTNATRVEYENQLNLPRHVDYDGRTYTVTLRATF